MSHSIRHTAIVEQVEPQWVSVVMQVDSACGSCRARHICGSGDEGERRITIRMEDTSHWQVGEQAIVAVERNMGLKAVVVAYLLPLMMMMATLLALIEQGMGETTAGLSALGVAVLYYIGLYQFREKISRDIVFTLHKK